MSIFVKEFQTEYARLRTEARASQDQTAKLVADVEKKVTAIMVAIEDGFYQPEMKGRMDWLVAEKARLLEMAASGELAEKVVLHPRMHELYARKVRELGRRGRAGCHGDHSLTHHESDRWAQHREQWI